jgi:hypothetical protein
LGQRRSYGPRTDIAHFTGEANEQAKREIQPVSISRQWLLSSHCSLSLARYDEQRALRKSMSAGVAACITEFRNGVTEDARGDEKIAYRLLLLPMKGPKKQLPTWR